VVWRKVLRLGVVSGCVGRKSDVGRGQGKVNLDVWLHTCFAWPVFTRLDE
jgi:hypothetical protein